MLRGPPFAKIAAMVVKLSLPPLLSPVPEAFRPRFSIVVVCQILLGFQCKKDLT